MITYGPDFIPVYLNPDGSWVMSAIQAVWGAEKFLYNLPNGYYVPYAFYN